MERPTEYWGPRCHASLADKYSDSSENLENALRAMLVYVEIGADLSAEPSSWEAGPSQLVGWWSRKTSRAAEVIQQTLRLPLLNLVVLHGRDIFKKIKGIHLLLGNMASNYSGHEFPKAD